MHPAKFLLMAGRDNQKSIADKRWNGSLFTDAFINGIKEKAPSEDKIITVGELYHGYLNIFVPREAAEPQIRKKLNPLLKDLGIYGASEGEFFFVRR